MKQRRNTHRRGRTRPARLALLDAHVARELEGLELRGPLLAVDVGFGDTPQTTIAWRESFERSTARSRIDVVGVESDPERVIRALPERRPGLEFVQGGFDLRAVGLRHAHWIRCMNVLRGYGAQVVPRAQIEMARALAPGGLLLEGSTDVEGDLVCAHQWRRSSGALVYAGLFLATTGRRGFAPRMFRDVLPRDLRRHYIPSEPIFELLEGWQRVWESRRRATALVRPASRDEAATRALRDFETTARQFERLLPQYVQATRTGLVLRPPSPSQRKEVLSSGARIFDESTVSARGSIDESSQVSLV